MGQTKGCRTDRRFPLGPRGSEAQDPSAFLWPGHQMSVRRIAKRPTIKAFSATTFKLHISSGTPSALWGWVGTVSLSASQGFRKLTASEFAGTERNLADLSHSLTTNHTKFVEIQERDLPKDTDILISGQRREASLPTSSEDLL